MIPSALTSFVVDISAYWADILRLILAIVTFSIALAYVRSLREFDRKNPPSDNDGPF